MLKQRRKNVSLAAPPVTMSEEAKGKNDDDGTANVAQSENARRSTNKTSMPTQSDLKDLAPEIIATIEFSMLEQLRVLFYPRLLLAMRRRQRGQGGGQHSVSSSASASASVRDLCSIKLLRAAHPLWKEFPDAALQQLLSHPKCTAHTAAKDDVVFYAGEPYASGIYVLCTGAVNQSSVSKKKHHAPGVAAMQRKTSWRALHHHVQMAHAPKLVVAPHGFGVLSPITEECYGVTVRAQSKCEFVRIPPEAHDAIVPLLEASFFQRVVKQAFADLNRKLLALHPLTPDFLSQFSIFSSVDASVLAELCKVAEPRCLPKDFVVSEARQPVPAVTVVVEGRLGVFRSPADRPQQLELAHFANGPWLSGASELTRDRPAPFTVKTVTRCDCFTVTTNLFHSVLRMVSTTVGTMNESLREAKQKEIAQNQWRYRNFIRALPLLSDLIDTDSSPTTAAEQGHTKSNSSSYGGGSSRAAAAVAVRCGSAAFEELIALFSCRVYSALSIIRSTATVCDSVMLLTKGRVSAGNDAAWEVGEFVGYAGLVAHRWDRPMVAITEAHVLELPVPEYAAFLKRHGAYSLVRDRALRLLFPHAFSPEEVQAVLKLVEENKTPPLHPISALRRVDLESISVQEQQRDRAEQAHGRGTKDATAATATTAIAHVHTQKKNPFAGLTKIGPSSWVMRGGNSGA